LQKVIGWLFGLYIVSHLTSTAGQEIVSSLLLFSCLFVLGKEVIENKSLASLKGFQTGANWPLLGFMLWATIGSVYNWRQSGDDKILEYLADIRWMFLFFSSTFLLKRFFTDNIEKHFKLAMVATVIVALYGVIQMFYPIDLVRSTTSNINPIGDYHRAIGFFNTALTYAYCLGMIGLFAVAYLFNQPHGRFRYYALAASVMTGLGLIASNTRGAWLAAIAAIFMLALLSPKRIAVRIIGAMAVISILAMLDPSIRDRAISIVDVKNTSSNLERIGIWRANVEIIKDHPVLGVGLGYSRRLVPQYYESLGIDSQFVYHPHNDLLDITAGTGIPGLIFYLWFCGFFLWVAFDTWRKCNNPELKSLALGSFLAQIYFHVGGLTQCNFSDNEVNHVLIFVWALTLGIREFSKRSYSQAL
jgi:O-antigen ligase